MLEELLKQCGFSENEQLLLAYLLANGGATAGVIAKRTGLKRPTTYAVLETLVEAGFATRSKREKVIRFSPLSPEIIPEILKLRAKRRCEEVLEAGKKMAQLLKTMPFRGEQELGGFSVETFESSAGVIRLLEEALLSGDFASIFDPQQTLLGEAKEVALKFLKESSKTKARIRELAVDGQLCRWYMKQIRNENHIVIPLSPTHKVMNDVIIYKNTVALMNYADRRETAIRIRQPEFYQTMLTMFEMLWAARSAA